MDLELNLKTMDRRKQFHSKGRNFELHTKVKFQMKPNSPIQMVQQKIKIWDPIHVSVRGQNLWSEGRISKLN